MILGLIIDGCSVRCHVDHAVRIGLAHGRHRKRRAPGRDDIAALHRDWKVDGVEFDLLHARHRTRFHPLADTPDDYDGRRSADRQSCLHRLIHHRLAERVLHEAVRVRANGGPPGHRCSMKKRRGGAGRRLLERLI
jgi:hypothetical protein